MDETVTTPEATPEVKALNASIDAEPGANKDEGAEAEQPKKEKSPEERELDRARRKIDRLYRQREELRAKLNQGLQNEQNPARNHSESDSEPLTLSRAELQELIDKRANELAPEIKNQQAEIEHRRKVISDLEKSWGKPKFDSLAEQLNEAFDGLTDRQGRPKPATDAIFETDEPSKLIEYLSDPDNADEAEAISRMGALQAGRAIAKLETTLKEKPKDKPQPSKVPPPIEEIKGSGAPSPKNLSDLSMTDFFKRRRAQIANRR